MLKLFVNSLELTIDAQKGVISSFKLGKRTIYNESTPIFVIRFRDLNGDSVYTDSTKAHKVITGEDYIEFGCFEGLDKDIIARVRVSTLDMDFLAWYISVENVPSSYAVEWVEFPKACLPSLVDNCEHGGKILLPYREGVLISDENKFTRYEPEYPSSGAHLTFPNTICSQFMAYLFDEIGLYIGAHDPKRGLKCVDFYPQNDGISMQMRLFSGCGYGEGYSMDFPVIWGVCRGNWRSAADIYRTWFEKNLPPKAVSVFQNTSLPQWYKGSPLIVTYPVRGIHDMDTMEPNSLFPYTNALPIIDEIKSKTKAQIMALLMHWEGTAPWAPPYVWPPYGGEALLNEFKDALHKSDNLLGVYCSGFGYTLRSTIVESYNCEERIKQENVLSGVCHSPQNKPELGITCCPYQRYGYDLCPTSQRGREILDGAYAPLFKSGVDYAQILDQNHGGGQYLCYARHHNHPPMPGEWMTSNMQKLLASWQAKAPTMLFGCETAAAEPFIGNLLLSDNRYELNYRCGVPVPVYAYLYHEYVRNFMGNQVGCPFDTKVDTLRYRLAYSFSIGDLMTLTLSPLGGFMTHWGTGDFENCPDTELTLTFIKNMTKFYNSKSKKYLYGGRMSQNFQAECESVEIPKLNGDSCYLPRVLISSWEEEQGKTAYVIVNPENYALSVKIEGQSYECPALDAILVVK